MHCNCSEQMRMRNGSSIMSTLLFVYMYIVTSLASAIDGHELLLSAAGLEEKTCPHKCCDGDYGGRIKCYNYTIPGVVSAIKRGYWIGKYKDTTVVGFCKLCKSYHSREQGRFIDINVVSDQCLAGRNESSVLCSECNDKHFPAINSKTFDCLSRSECHYGMPIYFASNIIGLFLLILFIFVFDFFPASGAINALVFFAQMTTTTLQIDGDGLVPIPDATNSSDPLTANSSSQSSALMAYLFINGIWKLDFALPLNNVCILGVSNVIQVLLTDYLIAFFPLVPVFVLVLISSYIDKIKEVIIKPLRKLGRCVRKLIHQLRKREYSDVNTDNSPWIRCGCQDWSLSIFRFNRESSMQTLAASCLLLSFTKFSVTTFYLITPTTLYNISGTPHEKVLYYNGDIIYGHGAEFWNYSWFAVVCLCIFVVGLPMALLLLRYDIQSSANAAPQQHIKNCRCALSTGKWLARRLDLFFLVPYQKDLRCGSNDKPCSKIRLWKFSFGIHDCRWYAGWYFFLRLGLFAAYIFSMDFAIQLITQQIILSLALGISVIVRPYKRKIHNRVDAFILLLIIIVNFTVFLQYHLIINELGSNSLFYVQMFLIFIPPVMMTVYFFIKLYNNWRRSEVDVGGIETVDIPAVGMSRRINSILCGCDVRVQVNNRPVQIQHQDSIDGERQPLINSA